MRVIFTIINLKMEITLYKVMSNRIWHILYPILFVGIMYKIKYDVNLISQV